MAALLGPPKAPPMLLSLAAYQLDASRFESTAKTGQREEQIQDNWTEAKARGNRHRQRQMHRQRLKYKRRHKQMPKAMAETNAAMTFSVYCQNSRQRVLNSPRAP